MKKQILKIISVMMVLALLVALAGCGKGEKEKIEVVKDLNGYEFVFAYHGGEYEIERGTSAYGDIYLDKIEEIEAKYNCKIKFVHYENVGLIASDVHAKIMAGDKPFDILDCPLSVYYSLLTSKDLYAQNTIKSLKLDNENFSTAVNGICSHKDNVYGSWYGYCDQVAVLFYNKDKLNTQNIEDPYELYTQGKWNLSKFKEILKKVTVKNDDDSKTYGMVMSNAITESFLDAAGGGIAIQNADGTASFGLDNPKSMAVVNWMRELYKEKLIHPQNHWDSVNKVFTNGQAVFFPYQIWQVGNLVDMEEEFGMVPFPTADDGGEGNVFSYDTRMFVMPKTLTDPEITGMIYNEIATLSKDFKKDLEQQYSDYGLSEEAIECFRQLNDKLKPNPRAGADMEESRIAYYTACSDISKEPASTFAAIKDMQQAKLNDFYNSLP